MKRLCYVGKIQNDEFSKLKYDAKNSFNEHKDSAGEVCLEQIKEKFGNQLGRGLWLSADIALDELKEAKIEYELARSALLNAIDELDFPDPEDEEEDDLK